MGSSGINRVLFFFFFFFFLYSRSQGGLWLCRPSCHVLTQALTRHLEVDFTECMDSWCERLQCAAVAPDLPTHELLEGSLHRANPVDLAELDFLIEAAARAPALQRA